MSEVAEYFDVNFKRSRSKRQVKMLQTLGRMPMELGKSALVMGCGAGLVAVHIARQGVTTMGLDISKKAIEYAKQNNHNKNVKYLVSDATDFDLLDHKFDIIVLPGVVDHIEPNKLHDLVGVINKHAKQHTVVYVNFLISQFAKFRRDSLDSTPENVVDLGLLLRMFDAAGFIPLTMETTGNQSPLEFYEMFFVTKTQASHVWEEVYINKQEPPDGDGPEGPLEGEQT